MARPVGELHGGFPAGRSGKIELNEFGEETHNFVREHCYPELEAVLRSAAIRSDPGQYSPVDKEVVKKAVERERTRLWNGGTEGDAGKNGAWKAHSEIDGNNRSRCRSLREGGCTTHSGVGCRRRREAQLRRYPEIADQDFVVPGPSFVRKCAALKYTEVVMAQVSTSSAPYADLLAKVFDLTGRGLSRPLAESILSLDFPENDAARAAELNEKANEGTLTEPERDELQVYANVADLLAYWQLKAKQALQRYS